jgi:hypothetical protein
MAPDISIERYRRVTHSAVVDIRGWKEAERGPTLDATNEHVYV